jgi:hypothetical protein
MTVAKKTSRKPRTTHKKRVGAHHRHGHSYVKPYWPYLPMIAIVSFGLVLHSWLGGLNRDVLGYATEMNSSSLLAGTNNQRVANGLGSLALSSLLNQAAQAKANDMMVHDYWAHNSPTGVTPWYWISSVGYAYKTAGENLAYGFATSSDTITGWMNSAGHRANILNGSFNQVGFGIINAPNFRGTGPQTIVVAMYAQSAAAAVAAPAPTPAPAPAPVASTKKQAAAAPAPTPTPTPEPVPVAAPAAETPKPEEAPVATTATEKNIAKSNQAAASSAGGVTSDETKKISRLQTLSSTNASWSGFAISLLASVALLAFLLRHSFAWHRFIVKGERFILHHPIVDIGFVVIAVLGFILTQSVGLIK